MLKPVDDSAYTVHGDFGWALMQLRQGKLVRRRGWNGKGMFIYLVQGSTFTVNRAPLTDIYPAGTEITYLPHIDMKTATGECVPWLASQSDILAEDWVLTTVSGGVPAEPQRQLAVDSLTDEEKADMAIQSRLHG